MVLQFVGEYVVAFLLKTLSNDDGFFVLCKFYMKTLFLYLDGVFCFCFRPEKRGYYACIHSAAPACDVLSLHF